MQLVVKREEGAWAGRRGAMAWPMALLGNTMAHGGQASVEAHKGGSTGNSLTKNGASGWLCRRPALPSAVGSIGIEPTADGPWRRLSGGELGPWAHPSDTSRENGEHAATVLAAKSLAGDAKPQVTSAEIPRRSRKVHSCTSTSPRRLVRAASSPHEVLRWLRAAAPRSAHLQGSESSGERHFFLESG